MIYTLPIDITILGEKDIIDMSAPTFNQNPLRSSFIFIRNTDLKANFDFSKCTYEQKCEYLNLFMFDSFNVDIPILTNTWLEILLSKKCDQIVLPCLFNEEEIKRFVTENKDRITEVYQLIISLPLFALMNFTKMKNSNNVNFQFNLELYEEAECNINLYNFASMTYNPDFIQMIEPIEGLKPKFYPEYLMSHNFSIKKVINDNLPYMKMLSLVMSSEKSRQLFVDIVDKQLTDIGKENSTDEG